MNKNAFIDVNPSQQLTTSFLKWGQPMNDN